MMLRKMKLGFLVILLSLISVVSFASSDSHGAASIPVTSIIIQVVNFAIFVGILVFLLKKFIRSYFAERREGFFVARRKAEEIKKIAEDERSLIKERLQKLDSTADQTIEDAKKEAANLKERILKDAEEAVARIKEESDRITKFEIERMKEKLRLEVISLAMENSKSIVEKNMADQDLKRLQGEFVEKIQVVR